MLTCVTKVTRLHPVPRVIAAASCFAISLADRQRGTWQPVLADYSRTDTAAWSIQGWKKQPEFAAKAQEHVGKDTEDTGGRSPGDSAYKSRELRLR